MNCTTAAIVALLGYMPANDEVVLLTRSQINQYTTIQQLKARLCARRHKIKWRIVEDK